MTTKTKPRRTRVTKEDIAKAREFILAQPKAPRQATETSEEPKWGRDKWFGLVYCDSYGYSWITGLDFQQVCLGKTDEVLKVLKDRRINGENVAQVLQAVKESQTEIKIYMYHSDIKKPAPLVNGHVEKSVCITFKRNPTFLRLLDSLIKRDFGVLTIQKELRSKGYDIPYATLGRCVDSHSK